MDDGYFVESCGASGHRGIRRIQGGMLNWRRILKGARRRVYPRHYMPPYLQAFKQRVEMRLGSLDRRIVGIELRAKPFWDLNISKFQPKLMVLDKDLSGPWGGGPVGHQWRGLPHVRLRIRLEWISSGEKNAKVEKRSTKKGERGGWKLQNSREKIKRGRTWWR